MLSQELTRLLPIITPLSLPLTHPIEPYAHYVPSVKNLRMQNRLQHLPLFHIFHRLFYLVEWVECDQPAKGETPFFVQCNQFGDKLVRDGIAFKNPPNGPAVHDLVHIQNHLRAWCYNTLKSTNPEDGQNIQLNTT